MSGPGGDTLASVTETLAGLSAAARAGSLDATAALAAARSVAAELEHSELAFIEAARDAGATWTRMAAALVARNRQTPRSVTRTSPAATRVHQRWTRQRRRSRMPGAITTSRRKKRW